MPDKPSTKSNTQHQTVSAWFLGPKAENFDILAKAFTTIISQHKETRLNYFHKDELWITKEITDSKAFKASAEIVQKELEEHIVRLSTHSVPWFSPRYGAHMGSENSVPGIIGYLAAMLGFNQNNVAFEVSPVTTRLEIQAGEQISDMVGYNIRKELGPVAWGHIACDGTVANLESIWASRNLKFYPLSLRDAMTKRDAPLEFIADSFKIKTCQGHEAYMAKLSGWELLNLEVDTILDIPRRLHEQYMISSTFLDKALHPYLIQTVGKDALEVEWGIKSPQMFCTRTRHYSWPKGAAVAGIGSQNAVDVDVGIDARMDLKHLEKLLRDNHKEGRAVYTVVAVMGTTEEGAVDDLVEIHALRTKLQKDLGLSFVIHADAAWGAYFASTIPKLSTAPSHTPPSGGPYVPGVALCPETIKQLTNLKLSDSITVDPHKTAYTPYPAGGLCYRNGLMKNLLTWTAPYLDQGNESIGNFGLEGSKPGASASSVWLTHKIMPLRPDGLGALLSEASFTCRRFAAHWAAMTDDPHVTPDPLKANNSDKELIVVPFNLLPAELEHGCTPQKIQEQKEYIRKNILEVENEDLSGPAMELLAKLGSNLNVNKDVDEANYLNSRIYHKLTITKPEDDPNTIPFYLSSTTFAQDNYRKCATKFKERLGLEGNQDLVVLRNVVMSPFSASCNFVLKLADAFKEVLKDEVKTTLERGGMAPDIHQFVVQGSKKNKYLIYQPMFNKMNSCYQVILNADFDFVPPGGNTTVILENKNKATLKDLCCSGGSFKGTITVGSKHHDVDVTNIRVVKASSLNFDADYLSTYPKLFMPFYLYGTTKECHLTHLISLSPNIELCASNISLDLDPIPSEEDLKKGVIVYAHGINEASMEPFDANHSLPKKMFFFHAEKSLKVTVYADPHTGNLDHVIRLPDHPKKITEGTIKLGTEIYRDNDRINKDPWNLPLTLSGEMKEETKALWAAVV